MGSGITARLLLVIGILFSTACAGAAVIPPGPAVGEPELTGEFIIAPDGYRLPLHRWGPGRDPEAVVLALHGLNDHGGGFDTVATALKQHGIAVYAYDQRGFGATVQAGLWHGQEAMLEDALIATKLLRARYPDLPVFLMGKSMGGAVTLLTLASEPPPPVDGSILIAPAVWDRIQMPWYQRLPLWLGETLAPGMEVSTGMMDFLDLRATDDPEVRQALEDDPLVMKSARVDTLASLADLMGNALEAAHGIHGPALILYGLEDNVIPAIAICQLLQRLPGAEADAAPDTGDFQVVLYRHGYHMLTRYSRGRHTHGDIARWLVQPRGRLPGGRALTPARAGAELCPS